MSKKQVFIIGLDDFNLHKLQALPEAEECDFHAALEISEIRDVDEYDMEKLVNLCFERIDKHGKIDAIASYYDFPGTVLVPVIAEKYGLPGPSLDSILKCEHKFWSRMEQQKVVPEHIPMFRAFDPFDEDVYEKLEMIPPFWIKPNKSFRSFLAYRVSSENHFYECLKPIRENIHFMLEPFQKLMHMFDIPEEVSEMKESCIAETMISGHQCTLEGYVHNGNVVSYGVVDSLREENRTSFSRYEYPSVLPQEVQFRMADVTRRAIQQIGLDNSAFNVEYFYNQTADEVYLLEINPRISQAHTDMFEKVHGVSHHSIMLNLALGRKPGTLYYNGDFSKAAHFMLRTFEGGLIKKVPTKREINILKKFIQGLEVKIPVKEGTHTADMRGQDSYSFELANVFIGGRDQKELVEKYNKVVDGLTFEIEYDESVHVH